MSKATRIALALSFVAVLGLLMWLGLHSHSSEPRFQGRTLTEWIAEAGTTYASFRGPKGSDPRNQAALQAVKSIGTNGIPTLLKLLQAQDAPLKARVISWVNCTRTPIHFRDANELRSLAHSGFGILGKDAAAATPVLLQLAKGNDPNLQFRALFCLPLINPDKQMLLPILTQILHDPEFHTIQPSAASLLRGRFPEEAEKAGVYEMFPTFRLAGTNSLKQTELETTPKAGMR